MNRNTKTQIALVVFVLLLSSCASTRKGTSRFDESNSPYVKEQPKSTVKVKEVAVKNTDTKAVMVREEKVKSVDYAGTETIYRFYVILGSFEVLENAKNFRTQLVNEQFKPVILESEIGFYRVSVAAFNDEMAARDQIAQIRLNYEKYGDAWLLVRK
jgi:cell division protein FtsN